MKFVTKVVGHEKRVMRLADHARAKVLKSCGAYVRTVARRFIKHRSNPDKNSAPLSSPYDHFGLKRSIVFAVEGDSAYIGPRYIKRGLANVARLHEFGGEAVVDSINRELWEGVKPGMVAPVTSSNLRRADSVLRRDTRKDPKTGRSVSWVKIATKRQAEHATRLYRRMARMFATKRLVRYAPRPYMAPALAKSLPHLPVLWKNAFRQ